MRLKNGMNAAEIEKELLENSIKKNETRQIKSNLLYNESLKLSTEDLFDNGNILLPVSALKDYILYKDVQTYEIKFSDLEKYLITGNNVIGYDYLKAKKLNESYTRFVTKIIITLIKNSEEGENISYYKENEFEYTIDTRFFQNTIWHKNLAIGHIIEEDKKYFCLFIENNNKIFIFNDLEFDNISIKLEIEG